MKKSLKVSLIAVLVLAGILLGGDRVPGVKTAPEKKEPVATVDRVAKPYVPYDFDLTEYLTLGDISAVQAEFDDPTVCAESEIDAAVFQVLLSQANFEEVPATQKAELYNRVTINLAVLQNGEVLAEYSKVDYKVVIGLETGDEMDYALSEVLLGAAAGESRTAAYTYPDEIEYGTLAGKSVELYAEVKKVERQLIPQLIDATVAEISGETFTTVQEFRASIRQDILAEKELVKAQAVWLAIKRDAHVRRFPERELQDSITTYRLYYQTLAENSDLTLEQLVTNYKGQTMEEFEAETRAQAEEMVTTEMICLQLIRLQNITLSDEEYLAGAQEYYRRDCEGQEEITVTFEEYVEYYTEKALRNELLKDKALKAVVANAVRIG